MTPQLTTIEVESLVNKLGRSNHDVAILLLIYTGARISEVLEIDYKNIQSQGSHMIVSLACGKGSKKRTIMIPNIDLKTWSQGTLREFIFPGYSQSSARRSLTRKVSEVSHSFIGRHIHPHLFRHYYAMNALELLKDIRSVQAVLGHKSINSTMHYLAKADCARDSLVICEKFTRARQGENE